MHHGSFLSFLYLLLCYCFSFYCNIFACKIIAWRDTQAYSVHSTHTHTHTGLNEYICTHTFMRLLTSRGHQTDDDGGGGGWALDQHSHQDPHHQPCHRVRQHCIVLENVPCHFTWLNMPPTYTQRHTHKKMLVSDMTGLPRAMLNKIQTACFPKSKKVTRWSFAVNYTAGPQWDSVNCSAVTHLFVKHQLAESLSTCWGGQWRL